MPEYIFAAMIFFSVKSMLWKWLYVVADRQLRMPAFDWTSWRRVVVASYAGDAAGDAFQTAAGRTPVWWKLRRRQVRTKRGNREASSPLDSWLDFCSLTCANLLSFCAPLLIVKRKKLPWVPIKIDYFKRRALPGGLSSVDPMSDARRV